MERKEGTVKKNSGKMVVGYDLNNAYAQISYCMLGEDEPETVSTVSTEPTFYLTSALTSDFLSLIC